MLFQGIHWPAYVYMSNSAANQYHGTNPQTGARTLLAIPHSTRSKFKTSEAPAKTVSGLQRYGAYVADDAGWRHPYFCMEKRSSWGSFAPYGYDFPEHQWQVLPGLDETIQSA